ncbi:MAG: T9SS type A sorting domain-containing protein [Candidatus Cloacimonetes bacterium]|jgi:hypothetical protein|nr:T9SS type A sorting domain-containing protein [Candidatus Cloacimonadota bacterium]
MLLNNYLSKKRIICFIILILCLFHSVLFSQIRDWEQLFQEIDRPVADMKSSSIGLLFALPGNGGGLAYFTEQDSLNIYSIATNLGAVSIVPDDENNRIFCAFGCGSYSDGLYEFDVATQEFELIDLYFFPHFVKKLSSGFYYGYGYNMDGGLLHSANGEEWTVIDFFNNKDVTDIEENGDGIIFVAADNDIYIENDGSFNSFSVGLIINDIYVRNYPNNEEVYLACGDGGYVNMIYRVEYENGEITGLTSINMLYYPNRIYEYEDYLVVGCKDGVGLYLVEPEENGQVQEIGEELGIDGAYCFELAPINTPNFMVGTDVGVFLGTNLTSIDDQQLETDSFIDLNNYPNPFNPTTTISFSVTQTSSFVTLSVYNIKGQKIKTLISDQLSAGQHSVVWDGRDSNNKQVSSGIYFYKFSNEKKSLHKKMLLMK